MVMQKRKLWLVILGAGLGLWLAVGLGVFWLQSVRPTTEDALVLLHAQPRTQDQIANFAGLLARLGPDDRHRVFMHQDSATWFLSLPQEAQRLFLEESLPPRWSEFLSGSRRWSVGRLERLLRPSLDELENLQNGSRTKFESVIAIPSPEELQSAGVLALVAQPDPYRQFTARPLLERIQKNSQLGK